MSQESLDQAENVDPTEPVAEGAEAELADALASVEAVEATAGDEVDDTQAAEPEAAEPEADGVDAEASDDEAAASGDDEIDPDEDPVAAFKAKLRRLPGEWFVIHSYAGYEKRVKTNLENRIQSLNMEDYIHQVEVPMEEVVEIKNAQRKVGRASCRERVYDDV